MHCRIFYHSGDKQQPVDIFCKVHRNPRLNFIYPVQCSQLDCLSLSSSFTPCPEHRAGTFCQLSNHMNSLEIFEINSTAVSDTSHLFIIFFVSEWEGDLVIKVEYGSEGEVRAALFEKFWQFFWQGIFNLKFDVFPQFCNEGMQFFFQQNALGESHLIHGTVGMQEFHSGGAVSDLEKLSIFMFFDKTRLFLPNGFLVDVVLTWFSVAVGCQAEMQEPGQQDYQQGLHIQLQSILFVQYPYITANIRSFYLALRCKNYSIMMAQHKRADLIYKLKQMWQLPSQIAKSMQDSLPSITPARLILLATVLITIRSVLQKVLSVYFRIHQTRPQHRINTLEYSYFYHLSLLILVLAEVQWNMFDLAIWAGSYIGVGFIRKAIHVIRIQKDLLLSDCSYNKQIVQILSASKIFGLLLFLGSIAYFIVIQSLFLGTTVKLSSLLLFPTLMLAVDSIFLLISSHISHRQLLIYYNHNINDLSSNFRVSLIEKIIGNSVRIWHYLNVIKLFLKSFFQRQGVLDRLWILSILNAFYNSSSDLYQAISRYRGYNQLLNKFNRIFRPSKTVLDQNCVICMSELLNCRRLTSCGHLFHYKCLFEWIQNKKECPICRNPIDLGQE